MSEDEAASSPEGDTSEPTVAPPDFAPPDFAPPDPAPPEPASAEPAPPEPEPEPEAPPPPSVAPMPGAWATLSGGLDLSLAANRQLRGASVYIGLLTLAVAGPFVIIILAFGAAQGGFDWLGDAMVGIQPDLVPVDGSVATYLFVSGFVAFIGFFVISIESQIIAVAILGGRALGRPLTLREALHRSRQVFWRVVGASILVGFLLIVPNLILSAVLTSTFSQASEATTVIATGIGALLAAPFAYIVSGIVLGDVGAGESVRRSTRLARARWRLAIAVSSVGAIVAYIQLFASGAGVDILSRFGGALHLGFDSTAGTIALSLVVLTGVLAIGSLTFTLTALRDSPQIVAFVGMTGYGAGLDRSRQGEGARLPVRWISIPMAIAIVIGALAGLAGVLTLT
jgi:hypothetical protein